MRYVRLPLLLTLLLLLLSIVNQSVMSVVYFHVSGAARSGVENLSRSLSVEWAGDGVRVNCVAPGVVVSPTARDNYSSDIFDSARPHIPAKRLGDTQEVRLSD